MEVETVAEVLDVAVRGHVNRHFECSNAWGVLDADSLREDDLGAETFCRLGVTVALHFIALGVNGWKLLKIQALLKTTANSTRWE